MVKSKLRAWMILAAACLITLTLACTVTFEIPRITIAAPTADSQETPAASPVATIQAILTTTPCPNGDCANVCLSRLASIPQTGGSSESGPKAPGQAGKSKTAVVLVTYPVKGDELGQPQYSDKTPPDLSALQHDSAAQTKIWNYFAAIIPADQRTELIYYIVATDGRGGMLASVEQFSDQPGAWALVVDPADAGEPRDLTSTLLHEFGHLLTLSTSQVRPDQAVLDHPGDLQVYGKEAASCPEYFASGGCSLPGSYINQFFEQFWTKVYGEWSTVNAARQDSNYLALLAHFYRQHPTQFIEPYAATSPEEDMAESWSYFVLNRKPADDSVAHKKVLFFYGFPELVDLRSRIVSNICSYAASQ